MVWQSGGMNTPPTTTTYKNHRFPVEIISHAVWQYFRFCLSFRDVEELLLERGVIVTYEAIRKWCGKWGGTSPASLS
jgi:putative transposase